MIRWQLDNSRFYDHIYNFVHVINNFDNRCNNNKENTIGIQDNLIRLINKVLKLPTCSKKKIVKIVGSLISIKSGTRLAQIGVRWFAQRDLCDNRPNEIVARKSRFREILFICTSSKERFWYTLSRLLILANQNILKHYKLAKKISIMRERSREIFCFRCLVILISLGEKSFVIHVYEINKLFLNSRIKSPFIESIIVTGLIRKITTKTKEVPISKE